MRLLVQSLAAAALVASFDAVATRLGHPHRPASPTLLVEAFALWLVPALLAGALLRTAVRFVPRMRFVRRSEDSPVPAAVWIAAFAASPVLMHVALDAATSIGGNTSALRSPGPWMEGLALVTTAALLAWVAARVLRTSRGRRAALVVVVLCGAFLPPGGQPRPARPQAPKDAPNVLLLVWDTARRPSFSFLGGERETTPHLARFADDALVFENARSVTHFTFTSHLSMLTGRYPSEHGARLLDTRSVPEEGGVTLAQELQAHGYRTGGFVGTGVLRGTTGIAQGFDAYGDQVDPPASETHLWALVHDVQAVLVRQGSPLWNDGRPHWIEDFQRPGDGVLEEARRFVAQDDGRPWFCFVNLFDVHWPYLPSEEARRLFGEGDVASRATGFANRASDWPPGQPLTEADGERLRALYEAEFYDLDAKVAAFLDALDLDRSNTAVIVTADHGEAFGEGGRFEHEDILEPQVQVPLLLRLPGPSPRSGRIAAPVSGIDVAPTVRSLAGLPPREDDSRGVDLSGVDVPADRVVYVEDRDHHDPEIAQFAAYAGRFKLMWLDALHDAKFELYDLDRDPIGLVDRKDEFPDVYDELRRRLREDRSWLPLDRIERSGGSTDVDALKGLGYIPDER
ncbi:MAG: sulfatase [Planctomycetota bacterium]